MDTTFRCAILAFVQMSSCSYSAIIYLTILSFYLGIVLYIQVILADIKTLFDRIEKSLKSKDAGAGLAIFGYCKEAIDLHVRVHRHDSFNYIAT